MTTRTRTFTTTFSPDNLRPMGLLARLVKLYAVRVERQKLAHLDAHILNDIGKSRAEAKAESQRPAWDAPVGWMR